MKQKLGTRPYGHYVWGGWAGRRRMRVCPTGRARLVGFLPSCWPVSLPFWGPLSSKRPNDSHSERAPTAHKMDPYTANHQATQACPGSVAARGKKNLACQNLHSRLPRLPRLGLSDLTTRLSTQSGYRCQLNCVRSRSYVSITATSEIPLSSVFPVPKPPPPRSKVDSPNPGKF